MGEEYGETAPFQYFVNHSDAGPHRSRSKGQGGGVRCLQLDGRAARSAGGGDFSAQQASAWAEAGMESTRFFSRFYRELLRLRKMFITSTSTIEILSYELEKVMLIRVSGEGRAVVTLLHFDREARSVILPWPPGLWLKELDSAEERWGARRQPVSRRCQWK